MLPGLTQGLRRAAQFKANAVAVSDRHPCSTWHRLIERIGRLAGSSRELGLKQNDRVAYTGIDEDTTHLHSARCTVWPRRFDCFR